MARKRPPVPTLHKLVFGDSPEPRRPGVLHIHEGRLCDWTPEHGFRPVPPS